jgi:hypothetical protein
MLDEFIMAGEIQETRFVCEGEQHQFFVIYIKTLSFFVDCLQL